MKSPAHCRAKVVDTSGGRRAPGFTRFPVPDITSIIVDRINRKYLLLFIFHIRQHLQQDIDAGLSALPPRTGSGKQGRAT
jgi:hypothetical protein